jgi:hypothetical protein
MQRHELAFKLSLDQLPHFDAGATHFSKILFPQKVEPCSTKKITYLIS